MSSPLRPGADLKEQLEWYKTQYSQLETDLSDFQTSSKDLEEQLEKDVETAEKNERKWKEQVEKLNFEVEEWKTKHKQAKSEANNAQNQLQKEITKMREENRSLQLQLRDTEVMNDDYERQARNTETSLEDMETKYNAAIERGVLFEETIKQGEQEREELRIETQRLRDELSDLKVENEITLEKLRLAQQNLEALRANKPASLAVENLRARSGGSDAGSDASGITPLSPTASTPPSKSDTASDAPTPPSPPLSDAPASANGKAEQRTPAPVKKRSMIPDSATPRASLFGARGVPTSHRRGPSLASSTSTAVSDARSMKPPSRPRTTRASNAQDKLPRSDSLYQIRGLIGRMQKIEERVQNARSKLPAPGSTPKNSPRAASALGEGIPSSVTVRRSSKRPSASRTNSTVDDTSILEENEESAYPPQRRESHIKRLSFGIPRPASQAAHRPDFSERPPSAMERPSSRVSVGRPGSRMSMASQSERPPSRSGARTELGHYSSTTASSRAAESAIPGRPRSSLGGSYAPGHRPSLSVNEMRRQRTAESEDSGIARTPSRRLTLEKSSIHTPGSAIPAPASFGKSVNGTRPDFSKSVSGARPDFGKSVTANGLRRTTTNISQRDGAGEMRPPPSRRKASDVGETY
ncbi:Nuclear distribution protein nudE 1 [Fulvia fulva]|uniref:Nuclear distribution protein nudE 1 n=1 Tax=Passalora fulva TaxID=5499 RepID=A0A9Q8P9K0_PASFU|nr:Nuclear distribution protein nudE 1 [Fulvia fulva]KAK4623683.1 Nuclear distribution protein nudE 1 [Fulvia fulva]KAK4625471.1 Nuclear distribution protein nudE 1 [Fulvia fulva]UJO18344.1 Nuclear distribution protein nudE 1 [Fulvia fulva]WPV15237.1 Nuclear distribution protein nudE 1 [Fulvia fulva]WPV30133.1 Nuclear distribution protein nudE 1 [Fulvia fulva]